MLDAVPCALIARLLLAPHDFGGIRIGGNLRGKIMMGKRVKLLDAYDRHLLRRQGSVRGIACRFGAPRIEQIEIDLAAACDDAAHIGCIARINLGYDGLKFSLREFSDR